MLLDNGNIDNYIAKLEHQVFENRKTISLLKRVKNKYPKLKVIWPGRYSECFNSPCFNSPEINPIANKINIYYSHRCSQDTSLMLNCFIEINGLKIYSDPFEITIGDTRHNDPGYIFYKNWEDIVRKENFPDNIIEQIKEFIKAHSQLDLDSQ